jgi:hypothetical protein
MAEPREKAFVGIDPVSMKAMNDDLANAQALIKAQLPKLRSAFGKASVETTPIDRLVAIGGWIEAELPMLKRRQTLAQQLQKEALQVGQAPIMVKTEWAGNFPSTEAAVARAKELAGRYVEPGNLPPEVWDEVAKNQHDPDFAAAFAKALGPHAARMLVAELGHEPAQPDRLPALANLFATASHQQVLDDSWFPKFPAVPGMLPLMQFGNWDNDLLVRVGNIALDADLVASDNYRVAQVLAAVARSPIAATRLYQENFDKIQAMSRARSAGWTNGSDTKLGDPLGTFIRAATVDARSLYEGLRPVGNTQWPNPAEDLTRRLLIDLRDNPQRAAFAGVQSAYATIATEYYDDLNAAIAGPPVPKYFNDPDPGRPGVEAPDAAWRALVQQAMWDPKNAALLSTFFSAKYKENSSAITAKDIPGAQDANSFSNWQNGQVRGWFLGQLNTVKADTVKEVADYNARVKQWVDYFINPVNAAVWTIGLPSVAAPGLLSLRTETALASASASVSTNAELAEKAATDAGKTITGFVKDTGVGGVKDVVTSWFDREPPNYTTDTAWTSDSVAWQGKAADKLGGHSIKPVTDPTGTTWTGDPAFYEKMYGATFTTGSDEPPLIRPVAEMSPAAQRAYAAWLQDPAVQQAVWNEVGPNILGSQGR